MKKTLLPFFGASMLFVSALLPATTAYSSPVLMTQDDFQSYTADALLPKTAETGVHGTYAYGAAPGDIYVVEDPTNSANQVARITRNTTGGSYLYSAALSGTIQTFDELAAAGQGLRLSYDVYVSSANLNNFYAQLQYGNSGSAALMAVYFKPSTGGKQTLEGMVAGSSQTALDVTIDADAWYNLTYEVYRFGDEWAASAQITNKTTDITTSLFSDWVASISDTSVNSFLRINFYQFGTASNVNTAYIDNISLQVVPEPGSLALAGFGAAALVWARRRAIGKR